MSPSLLRRGSISSGACADTAPKECNLDEVPKEASPSTSRVGKHFDRVLLAVHFRRPPTACVVAFLARWYSTYFAHMVTIGPVAVTDCDSVPHVECQQGSLPSLAGGVMFRCYADVMRRYPGYRGYMLTNDDAVLVPPRLTGFDLELPWVYKLFGFSKSIDLDIPYSRQAVDEKWVHAAHYAELQEWWDDRAPPDLKDRYKVRAGGVSFALGHAFADFHYIPQAMISLYQDMSSELPNVWLEIWQPFLIRVWLANGGRVVEVPSFWFHPYDELRGSKESLWQHYNSSGFHPLKLGDSEMRSHAAKWLRSALAPP